MMNKKYSEAFYSILSRRLKEYSQQEVARPTYDVLKLKTENGIRLDINRLDKNLLEILFIQELCSDISVANLYRTSEEHIKNLRLLYSITDDVISFGHPLWMAHKLSSEIEDELGEKAYII